MSFISYETSKNMLELLEMPTALSEKVFLNDAIGRVLAIDIVAKRSDPVAPTSAMDGYAIQHADLFKGAKIEIMGDNPAGKDEKRRVVQGKSIKTFTGSIMPSGSDTLIPIENVTVEGNFITINEVVPFAFSVREIGESYRAGDILIAKGTKIGFAEIGVMAGLNIVMPEVIQKPVVSILATGSEILEIGEEPQNRAQIRSSNNYTIQALAQLSGASVVQHGIVKDDRESIMASFENALESSNIVVSTGGVSVGDYDFVKDIVPRLGAEIIFKGVNIKPGQHILLARRGDKFIVALPGFAYSSTVTSILYLLPLIRKFLTLDPEANIIEATLRENFIKRSKKTEFTACNLIFDEGRYYINFNEKKVGTSAILTNMLNSAALMITGEDDSSLDSGMQVNVMLLKEL